MAAVLGVVPPSGHRGRWLAPGPLVPGPPSPAPGCCPAAAARCARS